MNRLARYAQLVLLVTFVAAAAQADVFQWEYVNPADPSQGKQQSTNLAPDGFNVDAVPGAILGSRNLTMAYLIGKDLHGAKASGANLTNADLSGADLTSADLTQALAEFRQGRYESASHWANRAIEKNADGPFWVQAKMIQAMALARLRKMESAHKALAEGDELLREPHVDYLLHHPPRSFGEWTIAELLRREAGQMLGIAESKQESDSTPSTAHEG